MIASGDWTGANGMTLHHHLWREHGRKGIEAYRVPERAHLSRGEKTIRNGKFFGGGTLYRERLGDDISPRVDTSL